MLYWIWDFIISSLHSFSSQATQNVYLILAAKSHHMCLSSDVRRLSKLFIQGVSSLWDSGIGLLWDYYRTFKVLKGFLGSQKTFGDLKLAHNRPIPESQILITPCIIFSCVCHFISKSYIFSLSHRLGRRKILFEKRKKISDYALVMGMFGIIIMVIENELSSAGVYNKEDIMSTGLKTLISISTVVLLVLIVAYHMLEIQVHMSHIHTVHVYTCTHGTHVP